MLFAYSGCLSERHMNQSENIHQDQDEATKVVKIETVAGASGSVSI